MDMTANKTSFAGRLNTNIRRLKVSAVLLATYFAPTLNSHAAPVTFAFDAQITNVFTSPLNSFSIPLDVAVGDIFHGQFTFVPSPEGRIGHQDGLLRFDVGGVTLESSGYDIVFDLNTYGHAIPDPGEPIDTIDVSCSLVSSRTLCNPGIVPGAPFVNWYPLMLLAGNSPILSDFKLTDNLDIWNQFTIRDMRLSFGSLQGGGGFIDALVGPMRSIPEPATFWMAAAGLISFMARWRAPKRDV